MSEVPVEILWVGHEFNGPVNGLALYNNEKVWFNRDEDQSYSLQRIDLDTLETLEKNHKEYCEKTGHPLKHGDPHRIIRRDEEKKDLVNIKVYVHNYEGANMTGEYITTIKSCDISNFNVPRKVQVSK